MPKIPKLDKHLEAKAKPANDDPLRNPDGVFSGPSIRVARSDGDFAPVQGKENVKRVPLAGNYRKL